MKLRAFAQQAGVRYETAWRWFKAGKIKGRQLGFGTIIVTEELEQQPRLEPVAVVYARVSEDENRPNLDSQAERRFVYCVTPVTGHHLSGEQSPTFYGNESMLNVSLAPERLARTIV